MWIYEKRLEYPVRITRPDPRMAKLLMAQYGGPDSDVCANKEKTPGGRLRESLRLWCYTGSMGSSVIKPTT